jgi:hypothetical protein
MTPLAAQQDGTEAEDVLDRTDARWLRLREIIRTCSLKRGEFILASGRTNHDAARRRGAHRRNHCRIYEAARDWLNWRPRTRRGGDRLGCRNEKYCCARAGNSVLQSKQADGGVIFRELFDLVLA